MDSEKTQVAAASLTTKMGHVIDDFFKEKHIVRDGLKEQSNPYAGLSSTEQAEIVIEATYFLLSQYTALALIDNPKLDQNTIFSQQSLKLRMRTEQYHKMILANMEEKSEANKAN